ncbi:MAG: hypothetical protein J6U36_04260, partial [Oscillospiraceae bacterium]|nr:hypothetical protein [Oscillospiraceae bacterium]
MKLKSLAACLAACSSYIFFPLLTASCSKDQIVSNITNEQLFTLEYGNFEDELNVFDIAETGTISTSIAMQDGFFFIANGEAKKIMEMNSYGDLLNILYNDETNPRPTASMDSQAVNSTRKSAAYPFNEISHIAVDSSKYLYVTDTLPPER